MNTLRMAAIGAAALLLSACGQIGLSGQVIGPTQAPMVTVATTTVPATYTAAPTSAPTSQPAATGTQSVSPTQQGFTPLRVAVRAADDTVQIVDTGLAARQASQVAGLSPMGGSVGQTVYVLDFKDQPNAQVVDASGTKTLDFVQNPDYGLAVWPGNGSDKPRLAWATAPTGQPPAITQLLIADVDGSNVTAVLTETITTNTPPYQLVAQRWSADGQSLYFSREPSGIGGYIPFGGASSLYRYNLADKSVTELIPFNTSSGKFLCLDDLSPHADLALGHCANPPAISLHSMSGGSPDQAIQPPADVTGFRLLGGARFSPDASRVAFGLAKGDPSGEQGWVAVSDALRGTSKLVVTSPAGHYYTVVAWLNDNTLLLQDNALACNPACANSVWTVSTDGGKPAKLTDGTFLTLVGGQ
jgi:hypothetical protein